MENFVPISRNIVNHWIYDDAEYFKVWFEMLYRARYVKEPEKKLIDGKMIEIGYGQFIFGRTSWSERLKVSERRLRTLFERLTRDGMIEVVAKYPKFTIYGVVNYDKYNSPESRQELAKTCQVNDQQNDQQKGPSDQGISGFSDQQNDNQTTSRRPADDQQTTTLKESKERKEKIPSSRHKQVYAEDSLYFKMAQYFYDNVSAVAEEAGISHLLLKSDMQKWADEFRKLMERKNPAPPDKRLVYDVMTWVTADSFWKTNVLSASKFREKFNELAIKAKAGSPKVKKGQSRDEFEKEVAFQNYVRAGGDPEQYRFDE